MFDRDLDCLADSDAAAAPLHAVRPGGLEAWLAGLDPVAAAFLRGSGFAATAGHLALLPGGDGVGGAVLGLGDDRSPHAFGGLALAVYEVVRFGRQADDAVIAFCGLCVLGVQVAENAILRLIDRVFERES